MSKRGKLYVLLQKAIKIAPQYIDLNYNDTLTLFANADTKGILGFQENFAINMLKQVKISYSSVRNKISMAKVELYLTWLGYIEILHFFMVITK